MTTHVISAIWLVLFKFCIRFSDKGLTIHSTSFELSAELSTDFRSFIRGRWLKNESEKQVSSEATNLRSSVSSEATNLTEASNLRSSIGSEATNWTEETNMNQRIEARSEFQSTPTYKWQQTALDLGEFWEGVDVDSIQIRRLRTDAASQIRCLRTDATFRGLTLRLNSLLQFRFVASELTLLLRFVASELTCFRDSSPYMLYVDIFTICRLEK